MSEKQQQCYLSLWLFFGTTSFIMPISDSAMLIRLFHVILYSPPPPPPPIFGRNTCSWKCYGKSPQGFHITVGLPINFRNKRSLLDKKVMSHFARAKHYQHYINLYQHLKWQTSCHGTNIQIHCQRNDLVKPLKQNKCIILFKHCFN